MTVTYLPRGIIPPVEYACATGGGFVCCSSLLPSSPSQWSCVNGHVALYPPSLRADGVLPSSTNDLAAFAARLDGLRSDENLPHSAADGEGQALTLKFNGYV